MRHAQGRSRGAWRKCVGQGVWKVKFDVPKRKGRERRNDSVEHTSGPPFRVSSVLPILRAFPFSVLFTPNSSSKIVSTRHHQPIIPPSPQIQPSIHVQHEARPLGSSLPARASSRAPDPDSDSCFDKEEIGLRRLELVRERRVGG